MSVTQEDVLALAQSIQKSLNIEIEFGTRSFQYDDKIINTTVQYYIFPDQKESIFQSDRTFEFIANVFDFLPVLKKISVLILIYDTTRIESLKSLEYWLDASVSRNWVHEKTKIILVANKIDLQRPDSGFEKNILNGIQEFLKAKNIFLPKNQIVSANVSSLTLEGIDDLRDDIFDWVKDNGNLLVLRCYFINNVKCTLTCYFNNLDKKV